MHSRTVEKVLYSVSPKVSYDICKNNEHIAQLSLARLGYKLGETITAVLSFKNTQTPCYHVSVYFECHETITPAYNLKSKAQVHSHTRILLGESHQRCLNTSRTSVSFTIPSSATPDFATSGVGLVYSLRVEFITGKVSGMAVTTIMDGFMHIRADAKVEVEPMECVIPLRIYGALRTTLQRKKVFEFEIK